MTGEAPAGPAAACPAAAGVSEGSAPAARSPGAAAGQGQGLYRMKWRKTRFGAVTYPIAVCEACRAVIEPARREYSKGETHGEWVYAHEHPLKFIVLSESNRGWRNVVYSPGLERVAEVARSVWLAGASEREVEEVVRALLKFEGEEW